MFTSKALLLLISTVMAQETTKIGGDTEIYEGLVMGLGPGSFIVAIAAVIGLVIIFLRHSVQTSNLMVLAGFALPLVVLGILRSLPIQPLKSELNA